MDTNKNPVRINPSENLHVLTHKKKKGGENTLLLTTPDTRHCNRTTAGGFFNTLSPDYKFSPVNVVQNGKKQGILTATTHRHY